MIIFEAGLNALACSSGHECISKPVWIWYLVVVNLKFAAIIVSFFIGVALELSESHVNMGLDGSWLEEKLYVLSLLEIHAWLILAVVGAASLPRHLANKV